ncbi:LPS export ABC transporter permease LptG [Comamonas serinivorans]|uniref:LPS export ABC transporter permease LptG n=1 Tax=Comamonas serinivorans TaxID=1082851 RepID=A0A1Y0EPY4_9BURK|nr:LPS export ABC transporter permease LptG [Comamonas serinivorans]ARU05451.1 LPS export ABC transporter permease LptG [Comamonas serinivorans]
MKTIRRLIHGEVLRAVLFVVLGFLALFAFFDIVDELGAVGRNQYTLFNALTYVGLLLPAHLYDLLPIAVLIGAIYVMARLAADSEYTILRTSGMGPGRALTTLLSLGCAFVVLTFGIGDYVAPQANRAAQLLKARFDGDITVGQTGAWIKERMGEHSVSVNVGRMSPDGTIANIRIFEFDAQARLVSATRATTGVFDRGEAWLLKDVQRTEFAPAGSDGALRITRQSLPEWRWPTALSASMVAASLLSPDRMRTLDLFQYISHLKANNQDAQRYQIEFWRKVFYPLSCLVMMMLALPFAYLHFRSGNITGYVFGGVMAGISFFLLNNVVGFMGNLNQWQPWLTAATPSLIYTGISLLALRWLVLRQ